jgi:hypothetical protein
MSDEADAGADDVAPWTAASESLRSVVKWIAASFGALGALLIGTAPLAGLRQLSASAIWADWIVPLAFGAAALGAVGFIVWMATSLLTPSTITLPQVLTEPEFQALRRLVAADPTAYLGLWGNDVESFMENRRTEFAALANVDWQIASLPSADLRVEALNDARPLLLKSVKACGKVSARLLAVAGFHDLSRRFGRAKIWMFGAAVIVVAGVVGFVGTSPSSDKGDASAPSVVPTLVSLSAAATAEVGPVLGPKCPSPFKAILVSGGGSGPWQLLVTDPMCTNGTITLSKDQAVVLRVFPSP